MKKAEETEDENFEAVTIDPEAREIMVFGGVDMDMASKVFYGLRQLDRDSKKNISLVIVSSGGEEMAGWAIYDALYLARSKIIAQCYGGCMSIAALILQACDTRLLSPNCRFMIHNGTMSIGTQPLEKVKSSWDEEELLLKKYYEKLAVRSNLTLDKVIDLCNNESYMSAEQTVKYGFADGILK
jgi:ATP-dependent Clp protease, protease subunit